MEAISARENCDIHRAFVHETATVLSSTAAGFTLTDGPHDQGIDFCRTDSPVFIIAQCKCPERETLEATEKPIPHDRDAVQDLLAGVAFVLADAVNVDAPLDLKRFTTAYHESLREWPRETRLKAAIAIFGELTGSANNFFQNQRNEYRSKGVELLLWDWQKFSDLLSTPKVDLENMSLTFTIDNPEKEILKRSTSPICFVHAHELIKAWDEYQWNLVDWNVRAEVKNSKTNERIRNTLETSSGRRHFQDYNNGLLIVCKSITYRDLKEGKIQATLVKPQVINGCQTLLSLVRAYTDLPETEKTEFREKVHVLVRIIPNAQQDFIDKICLSTNDQNPMSPRSLRANSAEQRKIQQSFAGHSTKWFYERKDGQFEGLLSFGQKIPSFRPGDYQIIQGKKKYRTLDNGELAQEWLAFVGFSDHTLRGGLDLFNDNDDAYYKPAFLAHPSAKFWNAIRAAPAAKPPVGDDEYLEDGAPSVNQYLLAHITSVWLDKRRISYQRSRAEAIERLTRQGKLRQDPREPQIDQRLVDSELNKDTKYYLNIVLNNMRDVMLELYAMVLCIRYGPLTDETCRRILYYPPIRPYLEDPLKEITENLKHCDGRHILNLTYEFLTFATQQYIVRYGDVLKLQPRLKSYLAQRDTVNAMRSFALDCNSETVPLAVTSWCPTGKSFVENLPDLS
jgi:hypothetical protein